MPKDPGHYALGDYSDEEAESAKEAARAILAALDAMGADQ